jgi:hypothetical protein
LAQRYRHRRIEFTVGIGPADINGLVAGPVTGAMLEDPIFWIAIAVTVAGLVAVAIYIARD